MGGICAGVCMGMDFASKNVSLRAYMLACLCACACVCIGICTRTRGCAGTGPGKLLTSVYTKWGISVPLLSGVVLQAAHAELYCL